MNQIKGRSDADIGSIARDVLAAVALPADADFMGSAVDSLSGGMAKRLAIARALSMDPKVVFYDEPTTGLDPTSAAQVQDLIVETHLNETSGQPRRTTVIITHDKDLLRRLQPKIVMLHAGRVAFDGSFDDFESASSPIIRPYFDIMPALHRRPA